MWFLVRASIRKGAQPPWSLVGRPLDKVRLPMLVQSPLNVAFSSAENGLYVLLPATRTLLKVPISKGGQLELDTSL